MAPRCGTCQYYKPGEKVVGFHLDGRLELDELSSEWGEGGACTADPKIRPMPSAWSYNKRRNLVTLPTSSRAGRNCPRWDDGGRNEIPISMEQDVVFALEAAAAEAKMSPSGYLMQLLESASRKKLSASKPGKGHRPASGVKSDPS